MITLLVHLLALIAMPFLLLEHMSPKHRFWVRCIVGGAFVLVVLLIFTAGIALAFPENVRHGYPSCAACHVSGAAGGGALTPYGRSAGAEVMTTWRYEGEENLGFGAVELPEWVSYGGDMRYVNANGSRHVKFWMQRDVELAVSPIPGLTIGGSAGMYGLEQRREYRKNYVKMQVGDHVAVRGGRFTPAYGIMFADHRTPTRAGLGLGQGAETYNAEATISGAIGELTVTGVNGSAAAVDASAAHGYGIYPRGRSGWLARGALFLGDRTQLGVSSLRARDMHAYGVHLLTGSPAWFLLAEYDRRFAGEPTDLAVGRLGLTPWQGVNFGPSATWDGQKSAYGAFANWFPRPHLELSAQVERVLEMYESTLMFHYYL